MSMRALLLVALGLALTGCPEPKAPPEDPNVVATVNGEQISTVDFEAELAHELQAMEGSGPRTPEQVEPFKRTLLTTMVQRTLLLQSAKGKNLTVTPEEVDRRVLRASADFPAEGFDEALTQGKISSAELKRSTAALLTIEKLFQQEVYARVAVTEGEIRAYHEAHAEELQEPEAVRAAQIVVKGIDDARRIQAQLRAGKKFADLARKYSLSADAKVGGDLGFFSRGVMPPEFDEVAFKLGVGEVSEVVTSDYGFHLFKVLEKKAARKRDLAEVRAKIEERLLSEKRTQAQEAFVKELEKAAQIRINEQSLLAVSGRGRSGQ
jgi:peptidyl-prolyl cis-trans isomerase C